MDKLPEHVDRIWRPLVEAYFDPQDVNTALRIMWQESRAKPGDRERVHREMERIAAHVREKGWQDFVAAWPNA